MKILVASENPVKIDAVKIAFSNYFSDLEVLGLSVDSGVSHTPFGDDVYKGAEKRVRFLEKLSTKQGLGADYFVGIEGGIVKERDQWFLSNRTCILDVKGKLSYGTSFQYQIPEQIVERVINGMELGDIMNELKRDNNVKQKGGAAEFLSKGITTRKELSTQSVLAALFPHINDIYSIIPKNS